MLCHRCQTDVGAKLQLVNYPTISDEGREIKSSLLCVHCVAIVKMDSQNLYDVCTKLQELLDVPTQKDTPTLTPAQLAEGNAESDDIFPLIVGRVPSTVPDSLEAWCRMVIRSERSEGSMARMVDAIE